MHYPLILGLHNNREGMVWTVESLVIESGILKGQSKGMIIA
jgi:hypothetical protein